MIADLKFRLQRLAKSGPCRGWRACAWHWCETLHVEEGLVVMKDPNLATSGVFISMRKFVRPFLYGICSASFVSANATAANSQIPQAKYRPDNVTMIELRGTSEAGGLTGRFTIIVDLRTGRYVAQRDYGIYSEATGFDGRLGWKRDRSGASHFLDSDPARAITATEAWLFRRGWCEEGNEAKLDAKPDEKDGEVTETVWNVTPKGGISVLLCETFSSKSTHSVRLFILCSRVC
jgi:hypothetical protein